MPDTSQGLGGAGLVMARGLDLFHKYFFTLTDDPLPKLVVIMSLACKNKKTQHLKIPFDNTK